MLVLTLKQKRGSLLVISCLMLFSLGLLGGCATTGRGEFPVLSNVERSQRSLAVLPPLSSHSPSLSNSVLYHLNRRKLEETFQSVEITGDTSIRRILAGTDSLTTIPESKLRKLRARLETDWLLVFYVHDLRLEQFSTRDTERLQQSETSYQNIDVNSSHDSGPNFIQSRKSEYSVTEVPVTEDNIRVVLSMSAAIYNLNDGQLVWSGRRIERTEDELKDLSATELQDITIERIMYRINSRLTG